MGTSYSLLQNLGLTVVEVPGLAHVLMDFTEGLVLVREGLDEVQAETVTCAVLGVCAAYEATQTTYGDGEVL